MDPKWKWAIIWCPIKKFTRNFNLPKKIFMVIFFLSFLLHVHVYKLWLHYIHFYGPSTWGYMRQVGILFGWGNASQRATFSYLKKIRTKHLFKCIMKKVKDPLWSLNFKRDPNLSNDEGCHIFLWLKSSLEGLWCPF